jgi:hypothetical protein
VLRGVAHELAQAGVPLMLLPALAPTFAYQDDCGLRPLDGLHCLIRPQQQAQATQALAGLNWLPTRQRHGGKLFHGLTLAVKQQYIVSLCANLSTSSGPLRVPLRNR